MRLVVTQKPLRRILRWTQRALFAGAVSMLAYCGFVLCSAVRLLPVSHQPLDLAAFPFLEKLRGITTEKAVIAQKPEITQATNGFIKQFRDGLFVCNRLLAVR